MFFSTELIKWYSIYKRDLPWRHTKDPYIIWLSEIILQQTRVQQGLPYFEKFVARFPTVQLFAAASEQEVLQLWQGLGYYSRARNMHHSAKTVVDKFQGQFPSNYNDLITLKGIGDYTASAIASFSIEAQHAVLDGNVYRVLSRVFGISLAINSVEGGKVFKDQATKLLPLTEISKYNQAIMEFGALQCKAQSPDCSQCILNSICFAYSHQLQSVLPFKEKKTSIRDRYFNYIVTYKNDAIALNLREKGDIWQHLYDFPLIETTVEMNIGSPGFQEKIQCFFSANSAIAHSSALIKHKLTHQNIFIKYFVITNINSNFIDTYNITWINHDDFEKFPMPKPISDFVKNKTYNLCQVLIK